jgi:hypothetical protein
LFQACLLLVFFVPTEILNYGSKKTRLSDDNDYDADAWMERVI